MIQQKVLVLVQVGDILRAISLVILKARRGKLLRELGYLALNLRIVGQDSVSRLRNDKL